MAYSISIIAPLSILLFSCSCDMDKGPSGDVIEFDSNIAEDQILRYIEYGSADLAKVIGQEEISCDLAGEQLTLEIPENNENEENDLAIGVINEQGDIIHIKYVDNSSHKFIITKRITDGIIGSIEGVWERGRIWDSSGKYIFFVSDPLPMWTVQGSEVNLVGEKDVQIYGYCAIDL